MGCEAYVVESESALAKVVQTWDRTRPLFIEATFDPESYGTMTEFLR